MSTRWACIQNPRSAGSALPPNRACSLKGNSSIAPGCRASGYPGFTPTTNRKSVGLRFNSPRHSTFAYSTRCATGSRHSTRWPETDSTSRGRRAKRGTRPQTQVLPPLPIPANAEHPKRVHYEYERKGTASIFMFAEPLSGFRRATARPHRTKVDWAHEVAHLLETRYAQTPRIKLVCDNLKTHTKGAFYQAFAPDKARGYVRRIEFVYTPKHGSWLIVAQCEQS